MPGDPPPPVEPPAPVEPADPPRPPLPVEPPVPEVAPLAPPLLDPPDPVTVPPPTDAPPGALVPPLPTTPDPPAPAGGCPGSVMLSSTGTSPGVISPEQDAIMPPAKSANAGTRWMTFVRNKRGSSILFGSTRIHKSQCHARGSGSTVAAISRSAFTEANVRQMTTRVDATLFAPSRIRRLPSPSTSRSSELYSSTWRSNLWALKVKCL